MKYLLFILLFSSFAAAAESVVDVGISGNYAPYYLGEDAGIERDIFTQIMQRIGVRPRYHKLPLYRMRSAIKKYNLDVTLTSFKADSGLHISDPYIYYNNTVICNDTFVKDIKKIEDLKKYHFAAWQDAHQVMGDKYKKLFKPGDKGYFELPNLESLLKMFFRGRLDCLALDKFVIRWFVKHKLPQMKAKPFPYHFHPIFYNRTYFKIQFRDSHLRDRFNKALKTFRQDGSMRKVYIKYLGEDFPEDLKWSVDKP